MRIEAITRRKIIVELNEDDLSSLDITYDALDYASIETRRVIWVILDRVRETTGCDIDPSGQLLIDAMPRPTGGCILFFTIRGGAESFGGCHELSQERVLRKQEHLSLVFEFPGIDALLDCAGGYLRAYRDRSRQLIASSELFAKEDKYRLLICPARETTLVRQFFSEFGQFRGDDAYIADATREHWQRVGGSALFERFGESGISSNAAGPALPRPVTGLFQPGSVYV
ncbi:MAG: adaptor protein MecA [Oscillospiraceae bacterium]|nr:adaptor protein MecA [Oscillospiraceae bacterium]